jgi:hypothetical protein
MAFRASFDPGVKLVWGRDGKSFELRQAGGVFVAKRKPWGGRAERCEVPKVLGADRASR